MLPAPPLGVLLSVPPPVVPPVLPAVPLLLGALLVPGVGVLEVPPAASGLVPAVPPALPAVPVLEEGLPAVPAGVSASFF